MPYGSNGGWSWRILWDFYDSDSGNIGVAEPESNFTREPYGGAAGFTDYGDFDQVGDPLVFHDIVLRYLGGNLVSGNLSVPRPTAPATGLSAAQRTPYSGVSTVQDSRPVPRIEVRRTKPNARRLATAP